MAIGDIVGVVDTLEFVTAIPDIVPNIIHIYGNIYAIAYEGEGYDGYVKTVEILNNGQITDTVIDTYEFDADSGITPRIVHVSGNIYAIAFKGIDGDGFIKTITIATNGTITKSVIDTLEYDSSSGHQPYFIHVYGNYFAVVFQGKLEDGYLKTIEIADNGQITDTVVDTLEFDEILCYWPSIFHVSGNIYAIIYEGPDTAAEAYLKTVEISTSGQITDTVIDTFNFCTFYVGNLHYARMIHISGNIFAIASQDVATDGFVKTVEIATNGQITEPLIDSFEFDTTWGSYIDLIHVAKNVYAVVYCGSSGRVSGIIKTLEIADDGTIKKSVIDTLEYESGRSFNADIIHVHEDIFAIAYTGPDDDGWLKTVKIRTKVGYMPDSKASKLLTAGVL